MSTVSLPVEVEVEKQVAVLTVVSVVTKMEVDVMVV